MARAAARETTDPRAGGPADPAMETQVDRTVLSWARTSATLAVVSLLFFRWAADVGLVAFLLAALGLTAAVLIWWRTRSRARLRRAQFASGRIDPPLWTAAALCAISVLLSGAALLTLLLH